MFRSYETGFHIDFPNGWTVSVQWGAGHYCDNYPKVSSQMPFEGWFSNTAEVTAWKTESSMMESHFEENPRSYQSPSEVMDYMNMIRNLNTVEMKGILK